MTHRENNMNLVRYDTPVLSQKLPDFDFVNPPIDPIEFAKTLADVMVVKGGVGLAANQLGLPYRVFAVASNPVLVCYNPKIVDYTKEDIVDLEEGCLTFPGLVMKIKRPKSIKIRYTEPNGAVQTKVYTGLTARIMQHEIEHLEGLRFFDGLGWYEKEKVKRWMKKNKRAA